MITLAIILGGCLGAAGQHYFARAERKRFIEAIHDAVERGF